MKAFRKIISVILCITLLFTTVALSASAKGSENVKEEAGIVSNLEALCDRVAGFFESVFEKAKRVLGIGFDKVDVRAFSEDLFLIPGLDEDFVPQGICYIEELSLYAVSGYVKKDNSRIYLVNEKTGEAKKLILKDLDLHAGGIASYKNNVYVSAGGSKSAGGHIYHISTDVLKNANDGDTVSFDKRLQVPVRASALCASDDMLIVAEFYEYKDYAVNKDHNYADNKAWACGYKLPLEESTKDGEFIIPDVILSIPDKVQGLSITDSGKVVFSTSYGRKNDSVLYVYSPYKNWKSDTVTVEGKDVPLYAAANVNLLLKTKFPPMTEGADFHNGKLYILFESGAKIYSNAKEITRHVWKVDVEGMIK